MKFHGGVMFNLEAFLRPAAPGGWAPSRSGAACLSPGVSFTFRGAVGAGIAAGVPLPNTQSLSLVLLYFVRTRTR